MARIGRRARAADDLGVEWYSNKIHFKIVESDITFIGEWCKTKGDTCLIEIRYLRGRTRGFAFRLPFDQDPRENLKQLNHDISMAIQKWIADHPNAKSICPICRCPDHQEETPSKRCIKHLRRLNRRPIIRIRDLDTMDAIMMGISSLRETSLRSGGSRGFLIRSDGEGDPDVWLDVDLTTQAMHLKGRVPPVGSQMGGRLRRELGEEDGGHGRLQPDASMVQDLIQQLETATDPTLKRRIRIQLRKLGHRGGARQKNQEDKKESSHGEK